MISEEQYFAIREKFFNLSYDNEHIWVKKLRSILYSDIHEQPLGCRISNTHIRIGKVHLDTFFEAQILFSHAQWIQRFANELYLKIVERNENILANNNKIVLIGYETYMEPVMSRLKEVFKEQTNGGANVEYCIYEEQKYTYLQNLKAPEIRYIENVFKTISGKDLKNLQIIFICGISTTLSTYDKMRKQLIYDIHELNAQITQNEINFADERIGYLSIIQVLPNGECSKNQCKFMIDEFNDKEGRNTKEYIQWNKQEKTVDHYFENDKGPENKTTIGYIVDVECKWERAALCSMCYPRDVSKEWPIIQTSETSVVPIQRIIRNVGGAKKTLSSTDKIPAIDFFQRDKDGKFLFRNYLYYGHTVRGEHHFLYYIRTNHLFADIIAGNIIGDDDYNAFNVFDDYCRAIKNKIHEDIKNGSNGGKDKKKGGSECQDDVIHIIVSPSHFSSKMFCNAINKHVFDFKAHVMSFDPQKEYRSSFETKYSNYAYFVEQTQANQNKKLCFYYVDDQIITGSNFYRMTSLIKNLLGVNYEWRGWQGIFVVVNRNSDSTKKDYIKDTEAFYPLINISVPSIRSYADSCPMCKMRADAEDNVKKSVLDCNALHWMEKMHWNKLHTLKEAKIKNEELNYLKDRQFRRFYCENEIHKLLNEKNNGENIHDELVKKIAGIVSRNKKLQCEYLISCVKAISRPFIYYREDVKPVAMAIIVGLLEGLLINKEKFKSDNLRKAFPLYTKNKFKINVKFCDLQEIYSLLEILINSLAAIDSTYLLHYDSGAESFTGLCKIAELYDFVQSVFSPHGNELLKFKNVINSARDKDGNDRFFEQRSFYRVLLNAVKRIILGISGEYKSRYIECAFDALEENEKVKIFIGNRGKTTIYDFKLVQAIYLENSVVALELDDNIKNEKNLTKKYKAIVDKLQNFGGEFDSSIDKKSEITDIEFLYYDVDMQENGFDVYVIDEMSPKKSITELMNINDNISEEIENIKDNLQAIGYSIKSNKFLVKLNSYLESDIEKGEASDKKEKYVCLLIDLDDSLSMKRCLYIVRSIMQYRYSLTEIIRSDIDSGAIKASIQAAGSQRFLNDRRLSSHGGMVDWEKLFRAAYENLNDTSNRALKKIGYDTLNVLMNELISYGAACETLCEYFGPNNFEKGDNAFTISTKEVGQSDILVQYLYDRQNDKTLFGDDNASGHKYNITYEFKQYDYSEDNKVPSDNDEAQNYKYYPHIKVYPELFNIDEDYLPQDKGGRIYQLFLIGVIDVFIRNALRHGQGCGDTVGITIEFRGNADNYAIFIRNKKKENSSTILSELFEFAESDELCEIGNVDILSHSGHFTKKYFIDFLSRKVGAEGRGKYSFKMNDLGKNGFETKINIQKGD